MANKWNVHSELIEINSVTLQQCFENFTKSQALHRYSLMEIKMKLWRFGVERFIVCGAHFGPLCLVMYSLQYGFPLKIGIRK
jgi:hypothetical protein